MLKKIRLTDFKSFVDEEVELAPLTLLVGANASGKSNFLDAIRFLHGLSEDLEIPEVLNGEARADPDAWPGLRGRAEESARLGKSAFAIESQWNPQDKKNRTRFGHRIECQTIPFVARKSEWIEKGKRRLIAPANLANESSLISSRGLKALDKSESRLSAAEFFNMIQAVRFLQIQPSAMRDYGRRRAPMGNEGKNFSGVLATLSDDLATKQSLVDWLREVCAPEIEDLDFAGVKELGDVMAIFVERGGTRVSARSISDGTLRFLGTLLALRTAQPGEVLLIEEIEEGLHPTRIKYLLEILESAVHQQGIQVIATTHSPVVLQWLAAERLREVLVFGRVPDREGTLVRRLGDLPHFEEVIQREGIEELFTTGWLEMAL
jgi:predicted ATPase